jgi:hypothetical protein
MSIKMLMMKKLKRNRAEVEKGRKGEREIFSLSKSVLFALILILILNSFGCQPNQTILKDAAPSPTPLATAETKQTSFEEDLREMETADFDYIFVFRRKDGGVFDKEDQKYLRDNTPLETNRWRKSDDGKAFIAGSGFSFSPAQMDALRNRFIVEDHSKPEIKEAANKAANTQTNKENNESNKAEKPSVNKKEK